MLRLRTLVSTATALILTCALIPSLAAAPSSTWQWLPQQPNQQWYNGPRVSLPSADLMNGSGSDVDYVWRGASVGGHRLNDHQYDVRLSVSSRFEAGYDRHKIHVRGDDTANFFDSRTSGWWARYGWTSRLGPASIFYERRDSHAETMTDNNLRVSPEAATNTLGGAFSRVFSSRAQLHLLGAASQVRVGSGQGWTFRGGSGLDYKILKSVTAQGNANVFLNTGDVSNTKFGLTAGLHYEDKLGIMADVFGGYMPAGAPLAGDALSDAAAFRLDPAFLNQPHLVDLNDKPIGCYILRVGWVTRF
jgi:hypothetical protein